jgi:multidrug efflux pump subunit AcrA (membrane-fusion protein)
VKQGDSLVQLDSSSIEDDILAQQIVLAKAEAAKIKAEKDLSAAEIAVEEYLEGTFVQELHKLEIDLTVARANFAAAESVLQFANKMYKKGYATARELRTKEYALEQTRRDIGLAELKKRVLEKYSSKKTIEGLTSTRDSARAVVRSESASLQQERTKLNRLNDQLEKCTLRAPEDGMAIYANDRQNWGEQGPKIEPGARVNQFQAIIRLPDLRKMQVKALVHETKVDQLRLGMAATIRIQDREFQGEITSIANQPEPSGFWQGFIKEYAILVRIAGEPEQLKPGKTAELRILADERKNVLMVPVQCVVQHGTCNYAWVKTPVAIQRRELLLGAKNDTSVEILDGLREGELVLLTPRADSLTLQDET